MRGRPGRPGDGQALALPPDRCRPARRAGCRSPGAGAWMNSSAPAARAAPRSARSRPAAVADVSATSREEEGVLRHDPHLAAQRGRVTSPDVAAVDQDRARVRIVEAREQPDQGGLARAGRPHQRHGLAGLRPPGRCPVSAGSAAGVAQRHALQTETRPPAGRQRRGRPGGLVHRRARGRGSRTSGCPRRRRAEPCSATSPASAPGRQFRPSTWPAPDRTG